MEKQKEEKSVSNMRDRMPNDRDVVWVFCLKTKKHSGWND